MYVFTYWGYLTHLAQSSSLKKDLKRTIQLKIILKVGYKWQNCQANINFSLFVFCISQF